LFAFAFTDISNPVARAFAFAFKLLYFFWIGDSRSLPLPLNQNSKRKRIAILIFSWEYLLKDTLEYSWEGRYIKSTVNFKNSIKHLHIVSFAVN
jgi:hypothetical protein